MLVPVHNLRNIEVTKYFNYESKCKVAFLRDILPSIKDEAYVINVDDKQSKRTHWGFIIYWQSYGCLLLFF